jgi:hypothetical protein
MGGSPADGGRTEFNACEKKTKERIEMAFNFNYFKGSSMNQIQYALHYWMNALQPAEVVEQLKQEKEKQIVENVVVEGVERESERVPTQKEDKERADLPSTTVCIAETPLNLYE